MIDRNLGAITEIRIEVVSVFTPVKLSQESFVKIFQMLPCPAAVSTLHAGSIIEPNQAFCDMLGYSEKEIRGASAIELGLWFDAKDREKVIEKLRQQGSLRNFETRLRCKDGGIRWVLYNAEVLDVDNIKFLLVAMLDITHRKLQDI